MVLFAVAAGCTSSNGAMAPQVPASLAVPSDQVLLRVVRAAGVQIYECGADQDAPLLYAWRFAAPEAELFDQSGHKVGRHYAGPTWEASDGSRVTGTVAAQYGGPDPNAIAWLLLRVKSSSSSGYFAAIQSVQRLYTVGGKAPADGCTQATSGARVRVPYTADYFFYAAPS
jgi:hypothetical protein